LNDVHDDGLNYYNKVCEFDGATTASSLRRHATAVEVKDDSVDHGPGKATSISYVKTGEKARTSPVVFQTHRPDVGGREAIGKMLHVAGDRRMLKIVGERNVAVRTHSELLRDEVDVTYMSDALFPPLPPPTGPPETTINEVGPSEPLSVPDHVGTEMLEVPPALRVDTTSKACVFAHVPTEIINTWSGAARTSICPRPCRDRNVRCAPCASCVPEYDTTRRDARQRYYATITTITRGHRP
jgi:hypothetical protein